MHQKNSDVKLIQTPPLPPLPTPPPPSAIPAVANRSSISTPVSQNGAKQLSKLKRFLTTLQQFASDISPEINDRVKHLILNLIVSFFLGFNLFKL